jgi:hypothetical protein
VLRNHLLTPCLTASGCHGDDIAEVAIGYDSALAGAHCGSALLQHHGTAGHGAFHASLLVDDLMLRARHIHTRATW